MMIDGSLEMYPISEQEGKVHIAGDVFAFIGGLISIIAWISKNK